MKLYIIIVLDPDGPYVWSDTECEVYADTLTCDARHETGHKVIVRCVDLSRS